MLIKNLQFIYCLFYIIKSLAKFLIRFLLVYHDECLAVRSPQCTSNSNRFKFSNRPIIRAHSMLNLLYRSRKQWLFCRMRINTTCLGIKPNGSRFDCNVHTHGSNAWSTETVENIDAMVAVEPDSATFRCLTCDRFRHQLRVYGCLYASFIYSRIETQILRAFIPNIGNDCKPAYYCINVHRYLSQSVIAFYTVFNRLWSIPYTWVTDERRKKCE